MKRRRVINNDVKKELAARAAGRCEICGKFLFEDNYGSKTDYSENAHIDAFSPNGPRGIERPIDSNNDYTIDNLMFLCSSCHTMIDKNPSKYTREWLINVKQKHEAKIYSVGRYLESNSQPVKFSSRRSTNMPGISDEQIKECLFKEELMLNKSVIDLSIDTIKNNDESYKDYYKRCIEELKSKFIRQIENANLIGRTSFMLFGLAPQPLLIYLGRLFDDSLDNLIIRNLSRTSAWNWEENAKPLSFALTKPKTLNQGRVALAIEISGTISDDEIGEDTNIYRIKIDNPRIDAVSRRDDLDRFGSITRQFFDIINSSRFAREPICVYCAMPQSLAIKFGSVYMPNSYNRLIIYNKENTDNGKMFIETITIDD